jgi:phenylalanyl-tRNA synthetase beta chain
VLLKNGKVEIGKMGCIDPALADRFDIGQAVYIADLDMESLIHLSTHHEVVYAELNRFPSVVRDVAMVLDEKTTFDRVSEIVTDAGGEWLKQMEVFDIYKNTDHLGPGRMSMALRLTMEKKESTLTDREIDKWFGDVQKALVKGVGAEIRKG